MPFAIAFIILSIFSVKGLFVKAEEEHILGNKNAEIKFVEYSDFECPFCKKFYPTFKQLVQEYGDKVSFEYKHYPLDFHKNAGPAAEASECAAEQGKFWEFHDKIFENQSSLSVSSLKQWASALGLNTGTFNDCLDSGKYRSKVQADFEEGESLGVRGTPTVFINGQKVVGAQPVEAFKTIIDELLK